MKKQRKTWKKRIFASLVAVCMVFTLLPATAMAAEGTEGKLVVGVKAATSTPAPMDGEQNKSERENYQQNMAAIEDVKWDPANDTITVTANRSKMVPYEGGGGWKTYYALVMNFRADMQLLNEDEACVVGDDNYEINETNGKDISQAKEYVPLLQQEEYKKPIVFWLNAKDDTRTFTLKYTDPTSKKEETQPITVNIKDTSKLVKSAVAAESTLADAAAAGMSVGELESYKANMGAIKVNADNLANGIITVTANRKAMESYRYGLADGPAENVKKQKHYALVMKIDSLKSGSTFEGELNDEVARAEGCVIDTVKGSIFMPPETEPTASKTGSDPQPIVFWLDAEQNTSKVTLYREITQTKASSGGAASEGKTGGDTENPEAEQEVVYRATQEITINVVDSPDSIEPTITLNKTKATIKKGDTVDLEATTTPDGADIIWESDDADESVVIVSQTGKVAGVGEGEATITAKVTTAGGTKEATCDITVIDNNSSGTGGTTPGGTNPGVSGGSNGSNLPQNADIALNQDTALIYAKAKTQNTVQLKAVVVGNSRIVTWKSLNPRIATVKNGKVTAKKAGKATITATANGVTAKCVVTVKNPTIKLAKARATIKKGKKVRINATATPASKIKYKSNKKKVATVTAKGVVKGKKKGTAKITVTANGVKKTFTVKVK